MALDDSADKQEGKTGLKNEPPILDLQKPGDQWDSERFTMVVGCLKEGEKLSVSSCSAHVETCEEGSIIEVLPNAPVFIANPDGLVQINFAPRNEDFVQGTVYVPESKRPMAAAKTATPENVYGISETLLPAIPGTVSESNGLLTGYKFIKVDRRPFIAVPASNGVDQHWVIFEVGRVVNQDGRESDGYHFLHAGNPDDETSFFGMWATTRAGIEPEELANLEMAIKNPQKKAIAEPVKPEAVEVSRPVEAIDYKALFRSAKYLTSGSLTDVFWTEHGGQKMVFLSFPQEAFGSYDPKRPEGAVPALHRYQQVCQELPSDLKANAMEVYDIEDEKGQLILAAEYIPLGGEFTEAQLVEPGYFEGDPKVTVDQVLRTTLRTYLAFRGKGVVAADIAGEGKGLAVDKQGKIKLFDIQGWVFKLPGEEDYLINKDKFIGPETQETLFARQDQEFAQAFLRDGHWGNLVCLAATNYEAAQTAIRDLNSLEALDFTEGKLNYLLTKLRASGVSEKYINIYNQAVRVKLGMPVETDFGTYAMEMLDPVRPEPEATIKPIENTEFQGLPQMAWGRYTGEGAAYGIYDRLDGQNIRTNDSVHFLTPPSEFLHKQRNPGLAVYYENVSGSRFGAGDLVETEGSLTFTRANQELIQEIPGNEFYRYLYKPYELYGLPDLPQSISEARLSFNYFRKGPREFIVLPGSEVTKGNKALAVFERAVVVEENGYREPRWVFVDGRKAEDIDELVKRIQVKTGITDMSDIKRSLDS